MSRCTYNDVVASLNTFIEAKRKFESDYFAYMKACLEELGFHDETLLRAKSLDRVEVIRVVSNSRLPRHPFVYAFYPLKKDCTVALRPINVPKLDPYRPERFKEMLKSAFELAVKQNAG